MAMWQVRSPPSKKLQTRHKTSAQPWANALRKSPRKSSGANNWCSNFWRQYSPLGTKTMHRAGGAGDRLFSLIERLFPEQQTNFQTTKTNPKKLALISVNKRLKKRIRVRAQSRLRRGPLISRASPSVSSGIPSNRQRLDKSASDRILIRSIRVPRASLDSTN